MNAKLSVIIPCLNSSKYIEKCAESVLAQTMSDIEIIFVDAGSTDGTLEIINRYINDERVILLNSEKKSYGYQMNLGIRMSSGEYIGIVESDDYIDVNMYKDLYDKAVKGGYDYVKANYTEFYFNQNERKYCYKERNVLDKMELYNKDLNASATPTLMRNDIVAIWSGIYSKKFLIENNIEFNETMGASFQDTGFWACISMTSRRCLYVDNSYYRYRIDNPNSSTFQSNKLYCICDEFQYIQERVPEDHLIYFSERLSWIMYRKYKTNLERVSRENKFDFYSRMASDLSSWNKRYNVKGEYYAAEEWDDLKNIVRSPSEYLEQKMSEKEDFISSFSAQDQVIIYGAGRVAKKIAEDIGKEKIVLFVTTNRNDIDTITINGIDIPVAEISLVDPMLKKLPIIISTKLSEFRLEMQNIAKNNGFSDVYLIPYGTYDE